MLSREGRNHPCQRMSCSLQVKHDSSKALRTSKLETMMLCSTGWRWRGRERERVRERERETEICYKAVGQWSFWNCTSCTRQHDFRGVNFWVWLRNSQLQKVAKNRKLMFSQTKRATYDTGNDSGSGSWNQSWLPEMLAISPVPDIQVTGRLG